MNKDGVDLLEKLPAKYATQADAAMALGITYSQLLNLYKTAGTSWTNERDKYLRTEILMAVKNRLTKAELAMKIGMSPTGLAYTCNRLSIDWANERDKYLCSKIHEAAREGITLKEAGKKIGMSSSGLARACKKLSINWAKLRKARRRYKHSYESVIDASRKSRTLAEVGQELGGYTRQYAEQLIKRYGIDFCSIKKCYSPSRDDIIKNLVKHENLRDAALDFGITSSHLCHLAKRLGIDWKCMKHDITKKRLLEAASSSYTQKHAASKLKIRQTGFSAKLIRYGIKWDEVKKR